MDNIHSEGISCIVWFCTGWRHRSSASSGSCRGQRSTIGIKVRIRNVYFKIHAYEFIIVEYLKTYLVPVFAFTVQVKVLAHLSSELVYIRSGGSESTVSA